MLLNAYPLTVKGRATLWAFDDESGSRRRDMEQQVRVRLWAVQGRFWAVDKPQGVRSDREQVDASRLDGVAVFAAREALLGHATERNCESWVSHGEVHCLGLRPSERVGSFDVSKELVMRVAVEHYAEGTPLLVVRRTHRWTWAGTLVDPPVQRAAAGAVAARLSGGGPPTGRVVSADGDELVLLAGGEELVVPAADYTVRATPALVNRVGGAGALQAMLVASGSLTPQNRKNRNAVKDRFRDTAQLVDAFGRTVALPGRTGELTVADEWAGIVEQA